MKGKGKHKKFNTDMFPILQIKMYQKRRETPQYTKIYNKHLKNQLIVISLPRNYS